MDTGTDTPRLNARDLALLDRITWGANAADAEAMARLGSSRWLDRQLHPVQSDHLPADVQARIDGMAELRAPLMQQVAAAQAQQKALKDIADPDAKAAARKTYEQTLNTMAREAAERSVLRDLYSPDQLREQMTWFWFNHFNVHQSKANIRLLIGDYEDQAIRPHALGKFRDLLAATLRHPAMLRYLDNADNAVGHINENYAREIMELHTLGVGGGYSQADVQELARILTGVGVDANPQDPRLPPALQSQLVRDGLFEFNPRRHDYGDKVFLGHAIRGRGLAEVDEALDILARQPATARHVSRDLAVSFVGDDPPPALVDRMSRTFLASDGDIAKVLATMFHSSEFAASLGTRFKDPVHYVISAVRLSCQSRPIDDVAPIVGQIGRLGEALYGHETPDGYALKAASWNGPGQMEGRFEVARRLGGQGLPGCTDLRTAVEADGLAPQPSPATARALAQATSPADWNTLFLSSPDFMRR